MNANPAIRFPKLFSIFFTSTIILSSSIFFSSCLGPKKIDKWVAKQYGESVPDPVKKKTDYLTVSSPLIPAGNRISTTEKIPAMYSR